MKVFKGLMLAAALAGILSGALAGVARAAGISTYSFTTCNLPDTGQGGDYTATFGEDHDYYSAASTPSFTVYNRAGSSVTVDNRTGLMWVTNPSDYSGGNYVSSGTYTWENAIAKCESLSYAGYSDWRLPNIKELQSIVDYGRQSPSINTTYFLNTQSNYYWSSTTYVPSTTNAWVVYFFSGNVNDNIKTTTNYVRCVRGGP